MYAIRSYYAMKFSLSCPDSHQVDLLEEAPFESSSEGMSNYMRKMYSDETERPPPLYERILQKHVEIEDKTILYIEKQQLAAAKPIEDATGENYDPIYAEAMRQRLQSCAERKAILAQFKNSFDYNEHIHFIAMSMYQNKEDSSFLSKLGHQLRHVITSYSIHYTKLYDNFV